MTGNPLVSIVVPVYNTEAYLPRCLDSIRRQTWPSIEVWLVNDGSTDGSLTLCRETAAADSRFHVIDKPNSGVSDSRNAGLNAAAGKYLQFVDSDDYLTFNATETLVHTAESTGADLIVAHFYRDFEDRQVHQGHILDERVMTRAEYAEEMMKAPSNFYYGVLWNKLYRRSIVEANHLRFQRELSWCEDFLFNLEYMKYVRLAAAIPEPVYHYVRRENSLVMTESTPRKALRVKRETFAYYKRLYQQLDLYEEQKGAVYRYLISVATDGSRVALPDFMDRWERRKEHRKK